MFHVNAASACFAVAQGATPSSGCPSPWPAVDQPACLRRCATPVHQLANSADADRPRRLHDLVGLARWNSMPCLGARSRGLVGKGILGRQSPCCVARSCSVTARQSAWLAMCRRLPRLDTKRLAELVAGSARVRMRHHHWCFPAAQLHSAPSRTYMPVQGCRSPRPSDRSRASSHSHLVEAGSRARAG